jgi:hypothetical protein
LEGPEGLRFEEPADHALGRSQGGFGTKVHLVVEARGQVLAVSATAGQSHESKAFEGVMKRARRPRRTGRPCWPKRVAGDKGYNSKAIRGWLRRRRMKPVIPTKSNEARDPKFDRRAYRRRAWVEQTIGWYKERRALGTRYDKLAVNYVAMWFVASIEELLKKHCRRLPDTA